MIKMNSKIPWILLLLVVAYLLLSVYRYYPVSLNGGASSGQKLPKIKNDFCKDSPLLRYSGMETFFTKEYLKSFEDLQNEIKKHGHSREGHMGNYIVAQEIFWVLAKQSNVKTICETGFNMGHSTLVWLHANPTAHVYSFDIGIKTVRKHYAEYIKERYPERFTITWGDSRKTLPKFTKENPNVVCDLISVDGGHTFDIATADLQNFRQMANMKKNTLVIDNLEMQRLQNAWQKALNQSLVQEHIQCCYDKKVKNRIAVGEYKTGNKR